ncbi:hypothetical protein ACFFQW_24675 [Umezawaea endophytica]|uniref:Peptidase inhibitor family I36 n=1 Tax=Umezawaea endophytica TaxID=1654476 RepID=A0A9X2VIQ1_9PSEU|nr:hypothetical protein [Umezawaea endophytica]MCS7475793.1 hypothetical protein [Umezawaea endophytica]
MRKIILSLSMAVAAVIGLAMPGTAMAVDYETDYAVVGTPPSGELLRCDVLRVGVQVCFEVSGDRWWVLDNDSDGKSAIVDWENYRGGSLYRSGRCVNSHTAGTWASCNKNYYEGSVLYGRAGVWNRSTGAEPVYAGWLQFM